MEWYYKTSEGEYGPVSREELRTLATGGELRPTDFVRSAQQQEWVHPSASFFAPAETAAGPGDPSPPLGGWLILPALGLCLLPFICGFAVFRDVDLLGDSRMPMLENRYPGMRGALVTEIMLTIGVAALGLACAIQFFRRKRGAPALMIALYVTNLVVAFIVGAMLYSIIPEHADLTGTGRSVIAAAIWIPYFMRSKRVRSTFVR